MSQVPMVLVLRSTCKVGWWGWRGRAVGGWLGECQWWGVAVRHDRPQGLREGRGWWCRKRTMPCISAG
jgi:hypothetical protein